MLDIHLRSIRWSGLLSLGLFLLVPITPARAAAPTAVNACQTLSAPGNYVVTKNLTAAHGVFMTCPATESGIAAKGNGSTNLDEDTSSGVCTALNNKAP